MLESRAAKRLVAINRFKIKVYVYILYTVYMYYVYINTHTYMYILRKNMLDLNVKYVYLYIIYILYVGFKCKICIFINDIQMFTYKYFLNIYMCVYLYIHNKYTQYTHI